MSRWLPCLCLAAAACAAGASRPGPIRIGDDNCSHCRMTIVSLATAAQIVAPGDEPVLFDDLGCLREFLTRHRPSPGARVFVADHRSGDWIDAAQAVFTRSSAPTPMGSGLIAHANTASRDADPAALHGAPVGAAFLLEPAAKVEAR